MISKRVGELLKETRESKKLTVREVAQETNITPRFIDALESEDYSVFPGETYTMGFLKGYAEFLNLDTEEILGLYRGLQIDQGKTPLKELTRPMRIIPSINKKTLLMLLGALAFAGAAYGIFWTFTETSLFEFENTAVADELPCADRQTMNITIPPVGAIPKVENMSMENTFRFAVDTTTIRICLQGVQQNPAGSRIAEFAVIVNEESAGSVHLEEGITLLLNDEIDLLSDLSRNINFTPRVLGDFSARVQLDSSDRNINASESEGVNPPPGVQNPAVQNSAGTVTTGDIQVSLKFLNDSYLQWTTDGISHTGLIMEGGKLRTLEAKNRLEIKIGNGGGVQILREGMPPRIAGPVGKFVRLTYRRVPDPLDPGLYKIQESIEVVR